jgi:hypothetical protein
MFYAPWDRESMEVKPVVPTFLLLKQGNAHELLSDDFF